MLKNVGYQTVSVPIDIQFMTLLKVSDFVFHKTVTGLNENLFYFFGGLSL